MDNEKEKSNEKPKKTNEDFYAVVSALARFIETADKDLEPKKD